MVNIYHDIHSLAFQMPIVALNLEPIYLLLILFGIFFCYLIKYVYLCIIKTNRQEYLY